MIETYITPLPTELVPEVWALCIPHLRRGLAYAGIYDIESIADGIASGDITVWMIVVDGAVVGACLTEVRRGEDGLFLCLYGLAGRRMTDWVGELDAKIEAYARLFGIGVVRFRGRPGWHKVVPNLNLIEMSDGRATYERVLS